MVPVLTLLINLAALGYGLYQIVRGGVTSLPLLLSVLWTVYNAVPPALLLYISLVGDTFGLQITCMVSSLPHISHVAAALGLGRFGVCHVTVL